MIDTKEILQWRKYNLQFLCLESCAEDLLNAADFQRLPECLSTHGLASSQGINNANFANLVGELTKNFNAICEAYENLIANSAEVVLKNSFLKAENEELKKKLKKAIESLESEY
jgi:hypothetical protein